MNTKNHELEQIRGIGKVLAQRFLEAGYDSFAKVAEAGEEEIRAVRGINQRMVGSIISQARELSGATRKNRQQHIEDMKLQVAHLKGMVQDIALNVRDRFKDEATGRTGRKIERKLLKVLSSLEKVEGKLESRVKRAGKGLAKAERRLEALADTGLKGIGKGLKKARKSLKKVCA